MEHEETGGFRGLCNAKRLVAGASCIKPLRAFSGCFKSSWAVLLFSFPPLSSSGADTASAPAAAAVAGAGEDDRQGRHGLVLLLALFLVQNVGRRGGFTTLMKALQAVFTAAVTSEGIWFSSGATTYSVCRQSTRPMTLHCSCPASFSYHSDSAI